jgi:hypothetical protein
LATQSLKEVHYTAGRASTNAQVPNKEMKC